jgi:hypothetical protein
MLNLSMSVLISSTSAKLELLCIASNTLLCPAPDNSFLNPRNSGRACLNASRILEAAALEAVLPRTLSFCAVLRTISNSRLFVSNSRSSALSLIRGNSSPIRGNSSSTKLKVRYPIGWDEPLILLHTSTDAFGAFGSKRLKVRVDLGEDGTSSGVDDKVGNFIVFIAARSEDDTQPVNDKVTELDVLEVFAKLDHGKPPSLTLCAMRSALCAKLATEVLLFSAGLFSEPSVLLFLGFLLKSIIEKARRVT